MEARAVLGIAPCYYKSRSGSQQIATKKKNVPFSPLLLISKRLSSNYPPMTQITQINQIFMCFTKRIFISASSAVRVFFFNGSRPLGDRGSDRLNILEYFFSESGEIRFIYVPWVRHFYMYFRGDSSRPFRQNDYPLAQEYGFIHIVGDE